MVQRKVPNKLGIEADHIKSEKRLGSLKPSTCQYPDGKNKGTDLKKKMKKSRSIKRSDIEGLRSAPVGKTIAQPGKPPPLHIPAAAAAAAEATPQKKSVIIAMNGSPNYMKSTTSSEAKKEISLVSSSRNPQTGSDSKNLRRRSSTGSNISSGSCNKPARTLSRTSNLKLVRIPTFKPARASAKKCSRVALCADIDAQRATCSSTLKDSKFPAYLMLNPGGTESEGTSVLKVCPYTYCSLNGHHHTPFPPLKCFLKARRRSLKTHRSMKMEALSPRRLRTSGDETEEFDAEQVVFGSEPASNGVDVDSMSPFMQERSMDFFIEIYAKSKGNDAEDIGSTEMNSEGMDDSEYRNETAPEHDMDKPVSESLSEGSPHSEIDFDENLEHCNEIISKVDTTDALHEDLQHKDADEDYKGILVKEESSPGNFHDGDGQESIVVDQAMFEVIDMKWDEWRFSTSEPDDETHSQISMETDDESDVNTGDSSESDGNDLHADESDSNLTEETLAAGPEHQVFEEDIACIDTCSQVPETICYDRVSSSKEMFQMLVAKEEEKTEIDSIGIVTTPSSTEKLNEGPTSGSDPPLEVPQNGCIIDVNDGSLESTEQVQLHSSHRQEQDETNEDYNVIQGPWDSESDQAVTISHSHPEKELPSGDARDRIEARELADAELIIEVNSSRDECLSTQAIVDESLFSLSQDQKSDSQHENTNLVDNRSILEEDQDEAKFKVPTCMDSEEQSCSMMQKTSLAQGSEEIGEIELDDNTSIGLDVAEMFLEKGDNTSRKDRSTFRRSNAKEELPDDHNNRKWTIGRKRQVEENNEEQRKFNPREPNFLPVVPEPDAEKVDLRHQMMDERKNAEEWMLDHALQQAVTKLAPARKRKVALLVEAFETVLPVNKYETRLRDTSTGFAHGRPIQACN